MFSGRNNLAFIAGVAVLLCTPRYHPEPIKVEFTKKKEKPPKHKPKAFHQAGEGKEAKDALVSKFMDRQLDRSFEKARNRRKK